VLERSSRPPGRVHLEISCVEITGLPRSGRRGVRLAGAACEAPLTARSLLPQPPAGARYFFRPRRREPFVSPLR
jgi:hypothetical protein